MRQLIIFLLALLITHNAWSQNLKPVLENQPLMPVGAYYYPEHWDRSQWGRDLKRMSELGFSFTHFAEFAWANIEPEEGKFDLSTGLVKLETSRNPKCERCRYSFGTWWQPASCQSK